ncbi:uncharacterized protein LOC109837241 [Asparagus officinalis]|uniref:uncharacterized protein LOC109837241 n=1 Tax=Asparagus officinalis TaxID=4686 RepID=UPI00098E0E2E|nr:uncharacterized protein LOC109837241 [Asparagus officinalis]XP_020260983.1 uncharacterized protein LOC109837241 [Asparagus officinalis]XP_020260984.1 uncharacterized protein LOC109837241 [Asparagus officinalis]XP_020260985.1 uncharacterized protein LOC109837241 [Asparagus officinalis]XP_020260986.1 uncharacterized protein LOC109837241 [Asparagus officinalis]
MLYPPPYLTIILYFLKEEELLELDSSVGSVSSVSWLWSESDMGSGSMSEVPHPSRSRSGPIPRVFDSTSEGASPWSSLGIWATSDSISEGSDKIIMISEGSTSNESGIIWLVTIKLGSVSSEVYPQSLKLGSQELSTEIIELDGVDDELEDKLVPVILQKGEPSTSSLK